MKSRSVSLTGATGFLGWHAADAFRDAGWNVRAIVRPGTLKPLPRGVEPRESPLDATALRHACAGTDLIVHAAGLTRAAGERAFVTVNVDGTRAVVAAANDTGARLILISSQAAVGTGTLRRPAVEDDRPRPLTAYGRSKLAAEDVVRSDARVPWTILRPSAIYGPRDRQFLPLFRLAARGAFWLAAPPDTPFTLIHARDVARAVVMAADTPGGSGQAFFLGHPLPRSAGDILRELARACGRPYRPHRVPRWALQLFAAAGDIAWRLGGVPLLDSSRLSEFDAEGFVCAVDRARDVMGFTATMSLPDGVDQTLRWYRDQGWMK